MDTLLLQKMDFWNGSSAISVSILVLMYILLLHNYELVEHARRILVSILVLMDILLLHLYEPLIIATDKCFNPCFNGYTTFT